MQEKLRISVRSTYIKIVKTNTVTLDSNNVRNSKIYKEKVYDMWKQQYAKRKKDSEGEKKVEQTGSWT